MNHIWGKPKRLNIPHNKEKQPQYQEQPTNKIEELENLYDRLFFAEKYIDALPVYAEILFLKANQPK